MSKREEQPPLRIRPGSSRILALFLLAAHGAALAVVFAIPLDWYWRIWLAAAVLGGLVYSLAARVLFLVPWACREATWRSDGTWILVLVSGGQIEPRLLPSSYVTQRLLVLNFRCGRWRSRSMVLLSDALDSDLLRRLRVRLRLRGAKGGSGADVLA